jgi:hypothetical protein
MISQILEVAISKVGRQESFVVEEQSSVFEFDCLIDCHFPASQSSHQFPRLLAKHAPPIIEVEVPFIAKQHHANVCWDVLQHLRLIVDLV